MSVPKIHLGRRGTAVVAQASTTKEPCLECQDETAAGSASYSDRLDVERTDGGRVFLCGDCHARARAARNGKRLTESDLQTIGDNGLMIGVGIIGI